MPPLDFVIMQFVEPTKRERITFLAGKPARRADLIEALLHDTRSLSRARMTPIAVDVSAILEALAARRAYVISAIPDVDDQELPLGEALAAIVGRSQDSMIVCESTKRAYYENHEGETFILA